MPEKISIAIENSAENKKNFSDAVGRADNPRESAMVRSFENAKLHGRLGSLHLISLNCNIEFSGKCAFL